MSAAVEQEILTVAEAAELTPWTARTVYRIAKLPDSPFRVVGGRIVTTREDFLDWIRRQPRPGAGDPMPSVRQTVDGILARVRETATNGRRD